jgi:hypothetical protein
MSGDRQSFVFEEAAGRTLSKKSMLMLLRDPPDKPENTLRQCVVAVARQSLDALRGAGTIGDNAYRPSGTRARLVGAQLKPAHE